MVTPFSISRERWSLKEIIMDEGDRPGRGGFALVLDDEHFPYFRYPLSRQLAEALNLAADGQGALTIALAENATVAIETGNALVIVRTPAGARRELSVNEAKSLARDLIEPLAQTLTGQV